MTAVLSVLLVDRDDAERGRLRSALEAMQGVQIAGERADLRSGLALARQIRPSILVLDLCDPGDEVLNAASHYRMEHPEVAIFLSADRFHPDTLMRAMRAGAQEVLRRPLDRAALSAAVERVAALAARRQGGNVPSQVFTVFSNKGGVGASMIATNLAISVHRHSGRPVALADLDFQSGDVSTMLGLHPDRSIADLPSGVRLDSAAVQDVMTKHATGVSVLAQPEQVDRLDGIAHHQVGSILEILSAIYEVVVVDAPHVFNDVALEIFDRSSSILVVAEPSIPSLRAARRTLDVFQGLNYATLPGRVRLVVNRWADGGAISRAQIEDTLGLPISFSVANDYAAVIEAINLGRPLCGEGGGGRAARDIEAIARELVPVEDEPVAAEAPPRRSRLRLFGRGKAA